LSAIPLRKRPFDAFLVFCFFVFSVSSLVYEQFVVFSACYLVFIFAFIKGRNWVRIPALLYGSAIVYSTIVYFGWEFLDAANRAQANLLAVFAVNIPYTVVPFLLMWRVRHPEPFTRDAI